MNENLRPGGWWLERAKGAPLRRTEREQVVLPLKIIKDGTAVADVNIVLTMAEAEFLHAQLCRTLDGEPVPSGAPDCRMQPRHGNGR